MIIESKYLIKKTFIKSLLQELKLRSAKDYKNFPKKLTALFKKTRKKSLIFLNANKIV